MCTKLQVLHRRVAEHAEVHPVELVQLHHLLHAQLGEILPRDTPCKGVNEISRKSIFGKKKYCENSHHYLPAVTLSAGPVAVTLMCGKTVSGLMWSCLITSSMSWPRVSVWPQLKHLDIIYQLGYVAFQISDLTTSYLYSALQCGDLKSVTSSHSNRFQIATLYIDAWY